MRNGVGRVHAQGARYETHEPEADAFAFRAADAPLTMVLKVASALDIPTTPGRLARRELNPQAEHGIHSLLVAPQRAATRQSVLPSMTHILLDVLGKMREVK